MKKFFLLLILGVSPAYASLSFTGFYGSMSVGGTLLEAHIDESISLASVTPGIINLTFPSEIDVEARAAIGEIGLGYSYQFQNHLVLSGEITAGLSNPQITHRNEMIINNDILMSKTTTELQNDFALLFKPGYVFNNVFQIYALIGPRWGNFSSTLDTFLLSTSASAETSSYELGITAGLGLAYSITQHVSFGLEYAYTHYGHIASLEDTGGIVLDIGGPAPSTFTDNTHIDANTNTFVAQLSYYF